MEFYGVAVVVCNLCKADGLWCWGESRNTDIFLELFMRLLLGWFPKGLWISVVGEFWEITFSNPLVRDLKNTYKGPAFSFYFSVSVVNSVRLGSRNAILRQGFEKKCIGWDKCKG